MREYWCMYARKLGCPSSYLGSGACLIGLRYVAVGPSAHINRYARIEALHRFRGQRFHPAIRIGRGFSASDVLHISCTKSVETGCLTEASTLATTTMASTVVQIKVPRLKHPSTNRWTAVVRCALDRTTGLVTMWLLWARLPLGRVLSLVRILWSSMICLAMPSLREHARECSSHSIR
jgi:hypothetical protein